MDIQTKVARIKTEIAFLIQGGGDLTEKQAALDDVAKFFKDTLAEEKKKPAKVEQ